MVQNQDFVISYKIMNAGDGAAYDIEITDRYDQNDFEIKSHDAIDSVITINIPEVPPSETHEVNVTVVPLKFGGYVPTLAKIKYSGGSDRILDAPEDDEDDEDDEQVDLDSEGEEDTEEAPAQTGTIGYSTSLGRLEIVEEALHLRQSSSTVYQAVSIYAVAALALVMLPYRSYSAVRARRAKLA